MHLKSIVHELLWFLRGETQVKPLQDAGVRIWNEWATAEQTARFGRKEGDLGPVYGHQWRNFGATPQPDGTYANDGVDQIARLLRDLRERPNSRRHLVTGWNPKEADQVALPPCHTFFQFYVSEGTLSCQLYQRSADVFLGVPFNIASYALLTMMIAQAVDLRAGRLHPHLRRRAPLPEPLRSGAIAARARAAQAPDAVARPRGEGSLRLPLRGRSRSTATIRTRPSPPK